MIIFITFFIKVLGPMYDTEPFATLQIELYCIVDYDSKWSTKFHKDCMFEIFVISLLRRFMIIFKHSKKIFRAHVRYRAFATLQIELYCIVKFMIASGPPNFIRIVCLKFL